MPEHSFKQMDLNASETAVGKNFNHDSPYAANSKYYTGLEEPVTGCPAPRKIIADTGAAVDLIGARDLHNKDKQRKLPSLYISVLLTGLLKQILLSNTIHQPWVRKYLPMC